MKNKRNMALALLLMVLVLLFSACSVENEAHNSGSAPTESKIEADSTGATTETVADSSAENTGATNESEEETYANETSTTTEAAQEETTESKNDVTAPEWTPGANETPRVW